MVQYTDEYISGLLEKFMNGTSSIEEEDLLGEYFRTRKAKPEWEGYRRMFAYFDSGMEQPLPTERLSRAAVRRRQGIRLLVVAAAVAVLCVMLFTLFAESGTERPMAQVNGAAVVAGKERVNVSVAPSSSIKHGAEAKKPGSAPSGKRVKSRPERGSVAAPKTEGCSSLEAMEELQKAEIEFERIGNEIAKYNSEAIMAQAALYGILDEITEERAGSGDALEHTDPRINYIRLVTMQ